MTWLPLHGVSVSYLVTYSWVLGWPKGRPPLGGLWGGSPLANLTLNRLMMVLHTQSCGLDAYLVPYVLGGSGLSYIVCVYAVLSWVLGRPKGSPPKGGRPFGPPNTHVACMVLGVIRMLYASCLSSVLYSVCVSLCDIMIHALCVTGAVSYVSLTRALLLSGTFVYPCACWSCAHVHGMEDWPEWAFPKQLYMRDVE